MAKKAKEAKELEARKTKSLDGEDVLKDVTLADPSNKQRELPVEEIEKEKEQLTLYQKKLEEVEGKLAAAAPGNIGNGHLLNESRKDLMRTIKHQQKLIEVMQGAEEKQNGEMIIAERALARSQYFFAEAALVPKTRKRNRGNFLKNVADAFWQASREAQEANPNQEIINGYLESAGLLEQAVKAFDEGKIDKANYLNNAGMALSLISREARQEKPNPRVRDCCRRAIVLYQQAVKAVDEEKVEQASFFNNAGDAFPKVLEEAYKTDSNPEIVNRYLRSAEFYAQAAKAFDEGKIDKATYLMQAVRALEKISKEEKKAKPKQEIIQRYLRCAELYEQAAKAFDEGKIDKATYLHNAGDALWKAAKEAKKEEPDQEVVSYYLHFVMTYEEAVKAFDEGKVDKATYLNNTANASLKAIEEEYQAIKQPNDEIVKRYLRSVELHVQAVQALDRGKAEKGRLLNEAGMALFNAAQEAQKENPNKKTIIGYHLDASIAEEAASSA